MSDPQFSEHPDPIRSQPTILVPAPQDDLLGIIARNTGPLAWVAMLFAGFAGLVIAWERKAEKKEVKALEKRILTLEKEVVRLSTTLKHKGGKK